MRASYKRADFPRGLVRGKYAESMATGASVVRLKPEIAAAFPTSEAVNRALAKVLREAKSARGLKRSVTRGRALLAKAAGRPRTS